MEQGLKDPTKVAALAGTPPEVWNPAAANTLVSLGMKDGKFDPTVFAQRWGSAPADAKKLYTQGSPDMERLLNSAATIGRGLKSKAPEPPVSAKGVVGAELLGRGIDYLTGGLGVTGVIGTALGGRALAGELESEAMRRALAGQRIPYNLNLPSLIAVAQQQGRAQGY